VEVLPILLPTIGSFSVVVPPSNSAGVRTRMLKDRRRRSNAPDRGRAAVVEPDAVHGLISRSPPSAAAPPKPPAAPPATASPCAPFQRPPMPRSRRAPRRRRDPLTPAAEKTSSYYLD